MPFDLDEYEKFKENADLNTRPSIEDQINTERQQELNKRKESQEQPNQFATPVKELGSGVLEGLKHEDVAPGGSGFEKTGNLAGKYGLLAAGIAAAPFLGPETLAGSGALASAATQFGGAAGGELLGTGISKALGGDTSTTVRQASTQAVKTGLAAAMTDLGISAGVKSLSLLPEVAQTFLKIPSEAIKRAITRQKEGVSIIPVGGTAQKLAVEARGMRLLKGIQDVAQQHRRALGEKVDAALYNLHTKTKGLDVFEIGPLAQHVREYMRQELQTAEPSVKELIGSDNEKLLRFLKTLETAPRKSAKAMVQIRRELDRLSDYDKGGIPTIQSDAGQRIYKKLAHEFREAIDFGGQVIGDTSLTKANRAAHDFYNYWDENLGLFKTKNQGRDALLSRLKSLEGRFNLGATDQDLIAEFGRKVPNAKKLVDQFMDTLAARSFTKHALGTVSGATLNIIRLLGHPRVIGGIIKAGASRSATVAGSIAKPVLETLMAGMARTQNQEDLAPPP